MTWPRAAVSPTIDDPRMPEPPTRRRFTTANKLKSEAAAAACTTPAAIGALLRREGLYSSHLAAWRKAEAAGTLGGAAVRRGPKPATVSRKDHEALQRQLVRAEARAARAEALSEL